MPALVDNPAMRYRTLGRTGLLVSEIGLGCEGFNELPPEEARALLRKAIEGGVNFIDMYSPNPEMHRAIAPVLREHPEVIVQAHLCTVWKDGQYKAARDLQEVMEGFDCYFRDFGVAYFPIGMIHYVDSLATWETIVTNGILDYAVKLKREGRIGAIGLSSHNPEAALAALRSGLIDVLMFSINPCYDLMPPSEDVEDLFDHAKYEGDLLNLDPKRESLYEACAREGIGIDVMKAFGGGELLSDKSPAGVALTPAQCIAYALDRPGVASIMCGVHSEKELLDSLAFEDATEEKKDYASALRSFPRLNWRGRCMYCGHCAPCPKGIKVAEVTRFLNLAKAEGGLPETVREHYLSLEHLAGECISCGMCAKRCPFGVDAPGNMKEALALFGK